MSQTKTVLITGSAIRIGRMLAEACAEQKLRLVLHYHSSRQSIQELSNFLIEKEIEHCLLPCDLSDVNATSNVFERIPAEFLPVDVLINSAGIFPEDDDLGSIQSHWESVMGINALAPILLTQQFAMQPEIQSNHFTVKPQVINILDARVQRNQTEHLVYRWSKKLLRQATHDLALTLAPKIRVNGIALGALLAPPGQDDHYLIRLKKQIPLNQTGNAEELKSALEYLLRQSFVTGEILTLDGGEFL